MGRGLCMKAYQFLLTLEGVEPVVWRRFVIPAETSFKRLHDTIQFAMGWQDAHLFEFAFEREQRRLEIVEDEEMYEQHIFEQMEAFKNQHKKIENEFEKRYVERLMTREMRLATKTKLPKYVEEYTEFVYLYDYGDSWLHRIKLEKIVLDYEVGYPVLLEGAGACPPEDVGGAGGYLEFLEAWNDPTHEQHQDMKRWGKGMYEPEFNIEQTNKWMREILKLKKIKKDNGS